MKRFLFVVLTLLSLFALSCSHNIYLDEKASGVARVGNVYFSTIQEAINYACDYEAKNLVTARNTTVNVLVSSYKGPGLYVPATDKNITVEFDSCVYEFTDDTTIALDFWESDNKVVFNNATFVINSTNNSIEYVYRIKTDYYSTGARVMKKFLFVTMAVLLVLSIALISCSNSVTEADNGMVEVNLGAVSEQTKSLSLSGTAPSVTWYYKAEPGSGNPGYGKVDNETKFTPGTTKIYISKGLWTFTVYGYSADSKLAYYGTLAKTVTDNTAISVPYTKQTIAPSDHALDKAKIIFGSFTKVDAVEAEKNINNTDMQYTTGTTYTTYTNTFTVDAGEQKLSLKYTDGAGNVYEGKIVFTAYAGYSYTIGGSININGLIETTIGASDDEHYTVSFSTNYQVTTMTDTNTVLVSTVFVAAETESVPSLAADKPFPALTTPRAEALALGRPSMVQPSSNTTFPPKCVVSPPCWV